MACSCAVSVMPFFDRSAVVAPCTARGAPAAAENAAASTDRRQPVHTLLLLMSLLNMAANYTTTSKRFPLRSIMQRGDHGAEPRLGMADILLHAEQQAERHRLHERKQRFGGIFRIDTAAQFAV